MRVLALRFFSPAEIKEIKERCWRSVRYERISFISFISAGLKTFCGSKENFLDFCETRAMQPCATLQPHKQVAKPLPQRLSATLQPYFSFPYARARETNSYFFKQAVHLPYKTLSPTESFLSRRKEGNMRYFVLYG